LRGYGAGGGELWAVEGFEDCRGIRDLAWDPDGGLFVLRSHTGFSGTQAWLERLTPAGDLVWTVEFPVDAAASPDAIAAMGEGRVATLTRSPADGRGVATFDADGAPDWDVEVDGAFETLHAAESAVVRIAGSAGADDVRLMALGSDGEELWDRSTPPPVAVRSLVVAPEGHLVVGGLTASHPAAAHYASEGDLLWVWSDSRVDVAPVAVAAVGVAEGGFVPLGVTVNDRATVFALDY
jgi:hypothetical protein